MRARAGVAQLRAQVRAPAREHAHELGEPRHRRPEPAAALRGLDRAKLLLARLGPDEMEIARIAAGSRASSRSRSPRPSIGSPCTTRNMRPRSYSPRGTVPGAQCVCTSTDSTAPLAGPSPPQRAQCARWGPGRLQPARRERTPSLLERPRRAATTASIPSDIEPAKAGGPGRPADCAHVSSPGEQETRWQHVAMVGGDRDRGDRRRRHRMRCRGTVLERRGRSRAVLLTHARADGVGRSAVAAARSRAAGRARRTGAAHLPRRAPRRRRRRLPRHEGRRPVPLARGLRLAGDARLGRGREQGHPRVPRSHPAARGDPRAAHRALELRALPASRSRRAAATSSRRTTACRTRPCSTSRTELDATPRVLLDPNTLSKDGTVALGGTSVSEDGKYLAYGSRRGRLATGTPGRCATSRPARTCPTRSSGSSSPAPRGRRTARASSTAATTSRSRARSSPDSNQFQKLYYHKLGTPQADDVLVYERPDDPELNVSAAPSPRTAGTSSINVRKGTQRKNLIAIAELPGHLYRGAMDEPSADRRPTSDLIDDFDAEYAFIGNDGPVFYFHTDNDAPRGRVIAIDAEEPGPRELEDDRSRGGRHARRREPRRRPLRSHLPEGRAIGREGATSSDGKLVREVELPGHRHGGRLRRQARRHRDVLLVHAASPPRHDLPLRRARPARARCSAQPKVKFDPDDYETKQVFYTSKDGTKVPMFLTHKKGLKLDGNEPDAALRLRRLQHPADAGASRSRSSRGWRWAASTRSANLRGGGEYGEDWHQAGTKLQEAERLRRLHRRGRVADREQVHARARSSRSRAAATAACSSARA